MAGLWAVIVGLVLCFAGALSLHVAVIGSGFALAWMLAEIFGASDLTALIIGVAGALLAWLLATVLLRTVSFIVGAVGGAAIGAKLDALVPGSSRNVVTAILLVCAVAAIAGFLSTRWRSASLRVICSLAGAALILNGLARAYPDQLAGLRAPQTSVGWVVAVGAWIALSLAGWTIQRRLAHPTTRSSAKP